MDILWASLSSVSSPICSSPSGEERALSNGNIPSSHPAAAPQCPQDKEIHTVPHEEPRSRLQQPGDHLLHQAPASPIFIQVPKHSKPVPAPGLLSLLCPLPGTFCPPGSFPTMPLKCHLPGETAPSELGSLPAIRLFGNLVSFLHDADCDLS